MRTPELWIGCSGWYYWHWKGVVYPETGDTKNWFAHYQRHFETVELNAPFYHWPKPATAENWARQAKEGFRYSLKVNQSITHEKRLNGTVRLVREFYSFADILGPRMGCFLFQLPPSFSYSTARLAAITAQLDPQLRSVVEFRHRSWWNPTVFDAFKQAGLIFCAVSAPRFPEEVVRTADAVYLRMHGRKQWYRYDYDREELETWVDKIRRSGASEAWVYFNNDREASAFRNAIMLRQLLEG